MVLSFLMSQMKIWACVAQWIENKTHDLKVVGSSPAEANALCPYSLGKALYRNSLSLPRGKMGSCLVGIYGPPCCAMYGWTT